MARGRHATQVEWFEPELRGILPLDHFHVPQSLAKFMRKCSYSISMNTCFERVITACADAPRTHDGGTWINNEIITAYCELHRLGFAHSVEVWEHDEFVGGLYGVSLGRAFFGESMVSFKPNASKMALVALVQWLREQGYTLLDTQYVNEHLKQFGVQEIRKEEYKERLQAALGVPNGGG